MSAENIMQHSESREKSGLVTVADVFPDANLDEFLDPAVASTEELNALQRKQMTCREVGMSQVQSTAGAILREVFENNREVAKKILPFFRDKPLLDVGAGDGHTAYRMAQFARELGASAYIGLDPYGYEQIVRMAKNEERPNIPIAVVSETAQRFLPRLSPGSCNMVINNLDEFILCDVPWEQLLEARVALGRLLTPDTVCIVRNSILYPTGEGVLQHVVDQKSIIMESYYYTKE
jgi:tRNA G46 methylase TrmB